MNRVLLTFVLFELPLREAELSLGLLQVPLESGDLRRAGGGGKQHRLLIHIRHLVLDSCGLKLTLRLAFISEHQMEYQGLLSIGR